MKEGYFSLMFYLPFSLSFVVSSYCSCFSLSLFSFVCFVCLFRLLISSVLSLSLRVSLFKNKL
jgi:hypothetical protein